MRVDMFKTFLSDPPRPLFSRCVQDFSRWFLRWWLMVIYQIRIHGLNNVPTENGMIVFSNHQSNLDPIVVGCSMPRRMNYLAKESLFEIWPLGWFLKQVDTIAIDRDGMGVGGMKETLRRLKRNESILIFPEGTRTRDGAMVPLKPGFVALAKRVKLPLLPIGIDGPFDSWPPSQKLPRPGRIHVVIGTPIQPAEISGLSDDEIVQLVSERIAACFELARERRKRSFPDRTIKNQK